MLFYRGKGNSSTQFCSCTNVNTLNLTPNATCNLPCLDNSAYTCGDSNTGFSVYLTGNS